MSTVSDELNRARIQRIHATELCCQRFTATLLFQSDLPTSKDARDQRRKYGVVAVQTWTGPKLTFTTLSV